MSKITASSVFSIIPPDQLAQYLDKFAKDVVSTVNGNLDFGNIRCQLISVNFSVANTSQVFTHSLGKVPTGYIPYGMSFSGNIYDGTNGKTATQISLQASSVGSARLIIF